jgi:hypothetical protein
MSERIPEQQPELPPPPGPINPDVELPETDIEPEEETEEPGNP